jgi:hypothetical protein
MHATGVPAARFLLCAWLRCARPLRPTPVLCLPVCVAWPCRRGINYHIELRASIELKCKEQRRKRAEMMDDARLFGDAEAMQKALLFTLSACEDRAYI